MGLLYDAGMRLRDHLLGVFVLWHISAVLTQVLPDARTFREPSGVLVAVDAAGRGWNQTREQLMSWTHFYQRELGVRQSWWLFTSMRPRTGRIEIHVQEDGAWRPLFIERSREAAWNAAVFDHYRWREAMFTLRKTKERKNRERFIGWVSDQIFEELPSVDAVRVDTVILVTLPPAPLRETGMLTHVSVDQTQTVWRHQR